jgi:hypothetical protein
LHDLVRDLAREPRSLGASRLGNALAHLRRQEVTDMNKIILSSALAISTMVGAAAFAQAPAPANPNGAKPPTAAEQASAPQATPRKATPQKAKELRAQEEKIEASVVSVDAQKGTLTVKEKDQELTLAINPKARIHRGAKKISLSDVKAGDKLKGFMHKTKDGKEMLDSFRI